jgi:amino acid transporter/mannitol/fructose-specific phosphotransferase system IIA component (Ntr-type)
MELHTMVHSSLKKELSLLDIFCIATGAMMSSGLFILPGLAFSKAGPAVVLSYIIAGFFAIPTLLSMAELTTAMPKAGGDYFYIMRGFGPLLGTVAGFSTWFSLSLKGAFALIGMGAYLSIITHLPLHIIASLCCVFFIILNLVSVKEASKFQVLLVLGLLCTLFIYVFMGIKYINPDHFTPFFYGGLSSTFTTASFVFISYGGLTKVVAMAEETRNPGKTLPLGMMLSVLITSLLYVSVIFVTVGVLNPQDLKGTLTPISEGANIIGGDVLTIVISIGAFLAFISTANAGIMTASRYPLGMSRDKLLPAVYQKISSRFKTPYIAILFTGIFMLMVILFLKLELLVKIASSILILLYIFANLTLILFRESEISSYRPKFRTPFYPYLQILGILTGFFLLIEMGSSIIFLTFIFLLFGIIWYKCYAHKRTVKDSAMIYVLEKLVAKDKVLSSDSLLTELRDIVIQRDDIIKDRFHRLIEESMVMDIENPIIMEDFFKQVASMLSEELDIEQQILFNKFMEREKQTSTVVGEKLAIPHIILEMEDVSKIILVRAKAGIIFPNDKLVRVAFVLVGSSGKRGRSLHLKDLAAIAQITYNPEFTKKWLEARNKEALKDIVLLADRNRW